MSDPLVFEPVYENGPRLAHYVNGRRLMAADLTVDQQTARERAELLGRAAGYGIVEGLEVSKASSHALTVTGGIAVNRQGETLHLKQEKHTVNLTETFVAEDSSSRQVQTLVKSRELKDCTDFEDIDAVPSAPPPVPAPAPLGDGVYVLAVRPIERWLESVTLDAATGLGKCENRWKQFGLEFRLIRLDEVSATIQNQNNSDLWRNLAAGWCFEYRSHWMHLTNPFTPHDRDVLLTSAGLEPIDVPLAIVLWWGNAIQWVDAWAVRRRVVQPDPALRWKLLAGDHMAAEGEARFYQFQDQLESINFAGNPGVTNFFSWLPPVGYLPIRSQLPEQPFASLFERYITNTIGEITPWLKKEYGATDQWIEQLLAALLRTIPESFGNDAGVSSNRIHLESFWKPHQDKHYEAIVQYAILDSRQALHLLHASWYDPVISLELDEPITVYLIYDREIIVYLAALSCVSQSGGTAPEFYGLKVWPAYVTQDAISRQAASLSVKSAGQGPTAVFARRKEPILFPEQNGKDFPEADKRYEKSGR